MNNENENNPRSGASKFAIECAATLLSRYSSPVKEQVAAIIQASINSALAQVMRENISLRLAIDDDTIALISKLEAERQKNEHLRGVLEYYANEDMYAPDWTDGREIVLKDRGKEARKALEKVY